MNSYRYKLVHNRDRSECIHVTIGTYKLKVIIGIVQNADIEITHSKSFIYTSFLLACFLHSMMLNTSSLSSSSLYGVQH